MSRPQDPDRQKQCQDGQDKSKPPTQGRSGRGCDHLFRNGIDRRIRRRLGVVRGRDPAIAAASDGFNEDGVLCRIAERIAQTIDGADDAAIEIDVDAVRPQDLTNIG
jgi:hypothetical protein